MQGMTPQQQQQRIDELTHAVNVLSGKLAALSAYVVAVTPALDPSQTGHVQGTAQGLAPNSIGIIARTPPKLAASEGVKELVALAAQRQTSPRP